jgi:enoyl-CoA hydratase
VSNDENARLRVTNKDGFTLAVLDRPEARNAIDLKLVNELHELCGRLEAEPQVLVITGAGGAFAAGADIRELRERGSSEALLGINSRVFDRIARLPLPTIAAVDGAAIGGGAELAYACDFRIASENAKFGNPEINLGIIAGAGACWRLKEIVGLPKAAEILLAGLQLDARNALACGLVSKIVPSDELLDAASAMAVRISKGPKLALQLTKIALRASSSSHPSIDDVAQAVLFQTDEKRQRMDAFLNRSSSA